MTELTNDWPEDADGGVFRRLVEQRFDFTKLHEVDYNVDFPKWPPAPAAVALLESLYGPVKLHPPEHGYGYAEFQVHAHLTYEGVTSVQRKVSAAMEPFGGVCESWGVMQDAP